MKNFIYLIICIFFICGKNYAKWNEISYYGGVATDAGVSFEIDGKLYAGGGLNSRYFASYDPQTKEWTKKADLPGERAWAMYFVFEDKAYIVGGDKDGNFNLSDEIYQYEPISNKWTKYDNFAGGKRDGGLAFVIGEKVYIGCGFDGQFLKKDIWEYDIKNKSWIQIADFPIEVIFPSVLDNEDRVFAGLGASQVALDSFFEFNKNTKAWEVRTSFPGGKRQACLDFEYQGRLLLGGGTLDYYENYDDVWEYVIEENSWVKIEELVLPNTSTAWGVSETIGTKLYFGLAADLGTTGYSEKFYSFNMENVPNIEATTFFGFSSGFIGDTIVKYIPIKNTGQAELTINRIEFENPNNSNFSLMNEGSDLTINSNSQDSIKVFYHPSKTGFIQEFLIIESNSDVNSTLKIEVVGKGDKKMPEISLNKNELKFADTYLNDTSNDYLKISNDGIGDLIIDQIYIKNNLENEFKIENVNLPLILKPDSDYEIEVKFTPKAAGLKNDKLIIKSNDDLGLNEISIEGNAIETTSSVEENNQFKFYPNPSSNKMIYELTLEKYSKVKIEIYDMKGLKINEICNSHLNSGTYTFNWERKGITNGTFNLIVTIDGESFIKLISFTN